MQKEVAMWAFNAADHQPGYRSVSDAASNDLAIARDAARNERLAYIQRLSDAWRTGAPAQGDCAEPDLGTPPAEMIRRHLGGNEPDENAQARRDAAWAAYRDQLGRAWQSNPRAATAIERQRQQWTAEL
jgi:hypothetical protein